MRWCPDNGLLPAAVTDEVGLVAQCASSVAIACRYSTSSVCFADTFPSRGRHWACPVAHTVRRYRAFVFAVARAICPQAFGTNAICRRQIQPGFDNAPGNVPTSRFPFYAVGASIARPAFGTNAICRRQIQPGLDNVSGWIALPGDCLLRKRGRPMTAPTGGCERGTGRPMTAPTTGANVEPGGR